MVDWETEASWHWSVSDTTALSLRRTLVTLTRRTSSLLRYRFLTATSNITEVFSFLKDVAVFILPVVEHVLDDVASKWQVVNCLI